MMGSISTALSIFTTAGSIPRAVAVVRNGSA